MQKLKYGFLLAYNQTTVRVPLIEKHRTTSSGQVGLDRYSGFALVETVLSTSVLPVLRAIRPHRLY